MSKSLEDQFKELGLANEKQVRKARQGKKKKKGKGKASRGEAAAPDPASDAGAAEAGRERADKAARDRELEQERQAQRRAKETAARVRQIAETHRIEREKGDVAYHFTQGSRIKEVWLSKAQHRRLADGEIGLVAVGGGYELVSKATAERIRDIDAEAVLVLNTGNADAGDDPYADFPVPDDLMW